MSVAACSEEDVAATCEARKERTGRIMGEHSMMGSFVGRLDNVINDIFGYPDGRILRVSGS